jgi:hypothetical protein
MALLSNDSSSKCVDETLNMFGRLFQCVILTAPQDHQENEIWSKRKQYIDDRNVLYIICQLLRLFLSGNRNGWMN